MWQSVNVTNPYNPRRRPKRDFWTLEDVRYPVKRERGSTWVSSYAKHRPTSVVGQSILRKKKRLARKGISWLNPYTSRSVPRFTHAARTPRQKRQWLHVYDSARSRGASEGSAIAQASGIVGSNPRARKSFYTLEGRRKPSRSSRTVADWSWAGSYPHPVAKSIKRHIKKRGVRSIFNPRKRNQNAITDALALKIADKVGKYLKPRKKVAGHKRRNVRAKRSFWTFEGSPHTRSRRYGGRIGLTPSDLRPIKKSIARHKKTHGFLNPAYKVTQFWKDAPRTSHLFSTRKEADAFAKSARRYQGSRKVKVTGSRRRMRANPALAVIGLNPKRDRYGRFVKRNVRARRLFSTREGEEHPYKRSRRLTSHYQYTSYGPAGSMFKPAAPKAVRKSIGRHMKKRGLFNFRSKNVRARRRFYTREPATGVRPRARGWSAFDTEMIGKYDRSKSVRKSIGRHKRKKTKGIFSNPKRRTTMATRRRRRLPPRNAKGHFIKASRRRRKSNPVKIRRRRHVRTLRRRRRTNPVRAIRRRRSVTMAHRRRRRRHNPIRHHRRRRVASAVNRRHRRRHNPVRHYRHRARSHRRGRRRNALLGGVMQRIDWKSVLFVSGGVFLGDKLSGIVSDKIMSMTTMIPSTAGPWVKLAVGVLAAGLAWKFQPAFGLGIAVGATNSLLNQYVFGPAWGYVAPTLGVSGLADYQNRAFKMDNWIGQSAGSNVAGLGMNPLLQNKL